jgi:glycerol-3-phosphate O-acyltransferase
MNKTQIVRSLYIKNSMVETEVNSFAEKVSGVFFRNIEFDSESLKTLQEYHGKGRVVYASFQSAHTPLMILVNLLKKNGLRSPALALDFTPNFFQMIVNVYRIAAVFVNKIAGKKKFEKISDFDYILDLLRQDRAIILSLLSRKLFIRRYIQIKSDTLQYLVEAQKLIDEPIYVFPQIMFWNQNPERTRTLVTSRATGDRGFFSGVFTVLKSGTPAFMRIPRPVNLKEEIANSPADDPRQIARKLRNKLLETYNNEKRTVLGPTIKSQQEMMEKVLYHKNVLDEIKTLKETEHQSENKLRKKAYKYFREIAADFSIINIKWFNRAVQYMFTKIFDGIYFNIDDLKLVREAAQRAPLILVPSHKSHIDYLLISSIFYENKIIPPHIVAGQNLAFFPMGPIFRRSGAFFMRRSFRGLQLYPTVFKQYIKTLISEGYPIEFFIEGTRTRTGKLSSPKMGILSYLIDAIEEGYNKDMIFVPITITYDRILEESSYHMELKGKEKETETTSAFVKSRKLLKRKYGKVYLSFNQPFSFKEYRDSLKEGEDVADSLGYFITRRISEIVMATPFSITSAAMLQSSAHGFTREMLKKRITLLLDYCAYAGVRMSDHLAAAANYDEIINYVLESYLQDNIVGEPVAGVDKGSREVLEGLFTLNENERARINFYKNNTIHYFLPLIFISLALLTRAENNEMDEGKLTEAFSDLTDLLAEEFIYSESFLDTAGTIAKALEYLEKRSTISRGNGRVRIQPEKRDELVLFAKAVQDFLESYLIVCDCVLQVRKKMSRKEMIFEVRKNGIKMFHLGAVKLTESLSMPNYENAIARLDRDDVFEKVPTGKKQVDMLLKNETQTVEFKGRIEGYLKPLQKE